MTGFGGNQAPELKIEVDKNRCVGLGACIGLAPGAFTLGSRGIAEVREPIEHTSEAALDAAVAACPTQAIQRIKE